MTSSRSIGWRNSFSSASCRSCVAPQIVSKKRKCLVEVGLAEFLSHGRLEPALDLLGFASQHGGLVGDADGLQMDIRIKAFGDRRP